MFWKKKTIEDVKAECEDLLADLRKQTACFTGHRPKGLHWGYDETSPMCIKFKVDLRNIIEGAIKYGLTYFLCGMAEGFDMMCAEIVLELKKLYPNIKLYAIIPCLGQEIKWKPQQQQRYKIILKQCDKQVVISRRYTDTCMNDRNKYMVNNSSVVIACCNGRPSGTGNTVRLAKANGCKVRAINPEEYR